LVLTVTLWSAPAFATGAPLTVTETVSERAAPRLSVTVRLNSSVAAAAGAVNVGVPVAAPVSVTAVPPVCVQASVAMDPSESLPEPFRLTAAPVRTS
jgi:hypothetical protein